MTAADFQRATALLEAMGPIEGAKVLSVDIDLREFINSNRLELDETEIRELKSNFRA